MPAYTEKTVARKTYVESTVQENQPIPVGCVTIAIQPAVIL